MARARRNNATISLFSFQDIITGVTAIVLLLTLLLLLELISRKATASLQASSAAASELIELTEVMAADQPPAVAFDGVPSAAAVRRLIDRRTRVATRETETLRARLQQVRDRALVSRTELREAREAYAIEAARAGTTAEFQQEAESLRRQLAELQTDRRELQRVLAQTEARAVMPSGPPKLQFRAADQTEAGSWLVVLGAAEIEAMPVSGGEPIGWTGADAAAQFASWLSAGRGVPRPRHCVVLIRPSGISFYEAVRTAIETADIAIGTEAIGEHQQVAVPTGEGGA